MIPKKLHYCWFGKGKKPASFISCLESWKKYCPDFEIVQWNEANAPTKQQHFYKNALRKKKYAFAADSVRAKVLLTEGGIYLDTDMLLLKPLEELLGYDFFIGEEVPGRIAFGLFGAVPNHTFLKQMDRFYENTEFNPFSPPVITHTFSPNINHDTRRNNDRILAPKYFYPLPYKNRNGEYKDFITEKSYAVHLWDHSWLSKKEETASQLLQNLATVVDDYLFHGYSHKYAKRYGKEFSRKLYHLLFSRQSRIKQQEPRAENQALKVLHLTTSSKGGAGIAALRLHEALREQGLASAYVSKNLTIDFTGISINDPFFLYRIPSISKKIVNKIKSLFFLSEAQKLQRKLTGLKDSLDYEMLSTAFSNFKMENHPLVKEADILHLHWVSGLIDFDTFFKKCKKPIIWTLHDMNPFQGFFHYENRFGA